MSFDIRSTLIHLQGDGERADQETVRIEPPSAARQGVSGSLECCALLEIVGHAERAGLVEPVLRISAG